MRQIFSALLLLVVLLSSSYYASAEDLSSMSTEDLLQLRQEINNELSSRIKDPEKRGRTVIEIFPDKKLALYMRDEMGAFSIEDEVTNEMLERVSYIFINDMDLGLSSLEGIQFLPNLTYITCIYQNALTELPDIGTLQNLYSVEFSHCGLTALPDSICNCMAMEKIDISCCPVTKLPDDIGNLSRMKELDISFTQITELPQTIRNLKLNVFKREGLNLGD